VRRILLGRITGQLAESRQALGPFQEQRNKKLGCHPILATHALIAQIADDDEAPCPIHAENLPYLAHAFAHFMRCSCSSGPGFGELDHEARWDPAFWHDPKHNPKFKPPLVGDSRGAVTCPTERLVEATLVMHAS
jgi:hypothetical protein